MADQPGIFSGLFDFSLDHSITRQALGVLYTLWAVIWTLASVFGLLGGVGTMADGEPFGLILIVAVPIVWFIVLLVSRIYIEMIVVLFRIADHTRVTAQLAGASRGDYEDEPHGLDVEGGADEPGGHRPGAGAPPDEP